MSKYDLNVSIDVTQYSAASAESVGLKNGVFYWTTGDTNGDYLGGLINAGSFDSIERSVDITETGGFFSDGTAGWSISGCAELQNTLDAYGISLTSSPVVISQDGYAILTGKIDSVSASETEFNFSATVKNILLDTAVPPNFTSDGGPIPIVLGSVRQSPCASIAEIPDPWITWDNADYNAYTPTIFYSQLLVYRITDTYSTNGITKVSFFVYCSYMGYVNYNRLIGKRLVVQIGDDERFYTAFVAGTIDQSVILDVYGKTSGLILFNGSNILQCTKMRIYEYTKESQISNFAIDIPSTFNGLSIYQHLDDEYQIIFGGLTTYTNPNYTMFSSKASQNNIGRGVIAFQISSGTLQDGPYSPYLRMKDMENAFDRSYTTYGYHEFDSDVGAVGQSYNFQIGILKDDLLIYDGEYYFAYDVKGTTSNNFRLLIVRIEFIGLDLYGNLINMGTIGTGNTELFRYNYTTDTHNIPVTYYEPETAFDSMQDGINSRFFTVPVPVVNAMKDGVITECQLRFSSWAYWDQSFEGWKQGIRWQGACVHCISSFDISTETIYADVNSGELYGSQETTTVKTAVSHLVDTYCGVTVPTFYDGSPAWAIGHTITDKATAYDELTDIAKQAFIAMFHNGDGSIAVNNWLTNTTIDYAFDETNIYRDSISNWRIQSSDDCYNVFTIQYDFDYATDKYRKNIVITNTDKSTFPDILGPWNTFVSGIGTGATAYAAAKVAWGYARESYLAIGSTRPFPSGLAECSWFTDPTWTGGAVDETLSAWKFAAACAYWFGLPKRTVTFSVSRGVLESGFDLMKYATFSDAKYTSGIPFGGWITGISIGEDAVEITMFLAPIYVSGDNYIETGDAAIDINETGDQTTNILEG